MVRCAMNFGLPKAALKQKLGSFQGLFRVLKAFWGCIGFFVVYRV